jgi:hypothetical protein
MNRFHSKYHRSNHHTSTNSTNPDAGHDPIASNEYPFQGDFVVNGNIKNLVYEYSTFSSPTLAIQSTNQINIRTAANTTITSIIGGVTGVTYSLTNTSNTYTAIIQNNASVFVRGGVNLSLGPYQSCNIKIATSLPSNIYSVW